MPSPRHANASPLCPRQTLTPAEPRQGQATWVRPCGKEGRANGTGVSSASRQAAGLLSRQVTGLRPQTPSSEAASVPKGRGPGSKGLGCGRSCHWGLGPPGENRQPRPADRPRRSQHPPTPPHPLSPLGPTAALPGLSVTVGRGSGGRRTCLLAGDLEIAAMRISVSRLREAAASSNPALIPRRNAQGRQQAGGHTVPHFLSVPGARGLAPAPLPRDYSARLISLQGTFEALTLST